MSFWGDVVIVGLCVVVGRGWNIVRGGRRTRVRSGVIERRSRVVEGENLFVLLMLVLWEVLFFFYFCSFGYGFWGMILILEFLGGLEIIIGYRMWIGRVGFVRKRIL